MAFTTLEQRFAQVSNQIYSRYAPSPGQINVVAPGTPSNIANDSRSLPIVSTARDVSRLTKFALSPTGVLFIGKQLLLQTGNTFAETRLYNPFTIPLTAVPFIGTGIARHVGKPFGVKSLKTPTRNLRGALQQETLDKFSVDPNNKKNGIIGQIKNTLVSPFAAYKYEPKFTTYFDDKTKEYYIRPEDTTFYSGKINLEFSRNGNFIGYLNYGIMSAIGGTAQFAVQPLSERGLPKNTHTKLSTFVDKFVSYGTSKTTPTAGSKTFKELENTLKTNGYFSGKLLEVINYNSDTSNVDIIKDTGYSTVRDPYNSLYGIAGPLTPIQNIDPITGQNIARGRVIEEENRPPVSPIYASITGDPSIVNPIYSRENTKPDIIKFIFRTNEYNANPVHFRAFISSLKENVKPEFSEQRYIGRTERFVTYSGAKRTVNMEFNIVAFGQDEIGPVWSRINYLTGLAFPKGYTDSGFMIPPLFKITIGGIYEDQPCYIETLDFDFIEPDITFDIDKEVPQVVNVKMNIILLEKTSKYFDSPFYKITETA